MADVGSVQGGGSAIAATILRSAEQNPEVAATLLKKATQSDKDLVNTLLPVGNSPKGSVDIRA